MFINALFSGLGLFARWVGGSALRVWIMLALLAGAVALWQASRATYWAGEVRRTQAAWDMERAASLAAKAAAETSYRSLADDADARHAADLAQGNARLAAYMAAHRLRAKAAGPARSAADHLAAIPEKPAAGSLMADPVTTVISQADLKICDANYVYARAAHDWANGLQP